MYYLGKMKSSINGKFIIIYDKFYLMFEQEIQIGPIVFMKKVTMQCTNV